MGNSDGRKFIDPLLKMNMTTWLTLALGIITLATPVLSSEPRVVCYYTNWSVYRPGTAKFNPQNINPYLCTHLIYAFGGFTKDNTLKPFDKYQDIEKGGYAKFTGLKTYNKNLKTLLAIGGWNEGSTRFSPMVASRERRKEFVRNAIKFLRQNRFDGLDLDWEYPAFRDGGKPKDRENYAKLVKELREEFEKESEKTGRPRLLLTMAVPAGIEYIQKGFDVKTLNQYLDWMNLLTYDYHSAFEPAVNHHAPLYPLEEPNEYSIDNELNIDYTIKFYLESGADRDKLVLGIPTYGRSYTLFNADAVEIGSPADGPGEQGDATREKGYLAYYEICEALKPKAKKRSTSDEDSEEDSEEADEEPWTVMYPNPKAMGPVAYKGNQWVGYDDVEIVKRKAEYVAENGLGGIMFWSIDNDDFRGNCHEKPYPLIEAAKEAYIARLGSTDNAIVTDRPRSITTARSNRRKSRPRSTTTTTTTTTPKPQSNKRKSAALTSTTPSWNIITPEPPTTPDPGSDFKCTDEGFFPHPRDCKKYFWCLDSGPSNLGIVAHQFTCPSGLFFNKAADSCDFARNVLCKKPSATTKAPTTKAPTTTTTTTTTTRRPVKLTSKSSLLFRTTTTSTTTTPEPESEEYEDEAPEDNTDVDAEDPRVIKELIDLIKKVGGVEQLEKFLHLTETPVSTDGIVTTTPSSFNKKLYQKVLERTRSRNKLSNSLTEAIAQNSRRGPQNAGLEPAADKDKLLRKDRPQYTTIQRARASTVSPQNPIDEEEEEDEVPETPQQFAKARAVETEAKVATTAKPLQYVNIRRARPTSDTADDTASRNALFERPEAIVSVSETPNTLDIASARRENMPEYVTIKRQRLTTEDVTEPYQDHESKENQETVLEREISSQPQYTSIIRTRSTTLPPPEEVTTPEPTTVLEVQISSLLNSASPSEDESPEGELETTIAEATEVDTTTTSTTSRPTTTTTTTTTTTPAPSSAPTRRTVLRRRGSTTTTTSTQAPSSTQTAKRPNFLRRTKSTGPPDIDPEAITTELPATDTSTNKFTRRGPGKFKPRKETDGNRRPSLNGGNPRNDRPRNFVRRRPGGANGSPSSSPSPLSAQSRRPFNVANRRRPAVLTTTTTTTTPEPTTTVSEESPTTNVLISEESLQDIGDTDAIEDPLLQERSAKKTDKVQRRPLLLKDAEDQNPSATNEEERTKHNKNLSNSEEETKRHSKKYSASFKQNQLDEVLKLRAKSKEEIDATTATTEGKSTTIDDFSAETALAIAAHQLLSAPLPSSTNYDYDTKPNKKNYQYTTEEHNYATPVYTEDYTAVKYTSKKIYDDEYSSTPIYKSTIPSQEYVTTTADYGFTSPAFNSRPTTTYVPETSYAPTAFSNKLSRPSDIATQSLLSSLGLSQTLTPEVTSEYSRKTSEYSRGRTTGSSVYRPSTIEAEYTRGRTSFPEFTSIESIASSSARPDLVSKTSNPSTSRYLSSSEKLIPVPVEDYSLAPTYPTGLGHEPSYFTREYLLESPVTKTYDDEYQYLSPVTTPQTTTRKTLPKKTVYRRISTTIRPTVAAYVSTTTTKPRRKPTSKPFEKIPVVKIEKPNRTYRPIENYDYYDDSDEKMANKYEDGTKVVLHAKGAIECLDIGNFPHPSSCKKFISCARLENGSLLGWEYICPKGLSFDPVGGICNWSAGLGCDEKDI